MSPARCNCNNERATVGVMECLCLRLSLLSIVSLQAIGGIEVKDLLRAGTFRSLSEPVHRAFRYYRVIVQLLLISSTYHNTSRIQYNNMMLIVSLKNLRKMVMINRHFIER